MSLNFGSICRLCMTQTNSMLPLFTENDILPSRIMVLVPIIKLHAGDGLPAQVCQQCVHEVNNSYNFRLQCESSDFTLRQYLSTDQPEKLSGHVSVAVDHVSGDAESDIKHNRTICRDGVNMSQEMEECSSRENKYSSEMKDTKESAQKHSFGIKGIRKRDSQLCKNLNEDSISSVFELRETAVQDLFRCSICGKSFTHKAKLNEHITRHVGGRPHICEVCGKRFTERSSLKKHALSHTGQKAHVCDVCGKRFTLRTHLKTHTLIHSGQKSHVCDVCGKRFSQLGSFRMHALLHTGEKPFSCSLCGKSFTQKNTLKIHIAAHTGQKPYVCDICGKSFAQRGHLKTHAIVHSGQKKFSCHVCGSSFTRKHNLKKHAARHNGHGLKPPGRDLLCQEKNT